MLQVNPKKKQIELLNIKLNSLTTVNTKLQDSLQFEALMIEEANNEIKKSDWSPDAEIKIIECGGRQLN